MNMVYKNTEEQNKISEEMENQEREKEGKERENTMHKIIIKKYDTDVDDLSI